MKRFIRLIGLEWKRAVKALPLMLAEAVVMCIFLGALLLLCQKIFFGDTLLQKIPIGLVMEEENSMTELAMTYLEGMESMAAACEFRRMTLEAGNKALEQGEIAALMVLPEEVLEAILDSRNYPVKVYFPQNSSLGTLLIKELTDAGAGMLSMAQAEIYAAYDMNAGCQQFIPPSELENDINQFNMKFAMARERMLRSQTLRIAEDIPLLLHYMAAGITLFLMLWGIACAKFLKGDNQTFGRQLLRAGVRRWQWMLAKLTGVLLVLIIGFCGILAVMTRVQGHLESMGVEITVNWSVLPYIAAVLACIAAFLLFCYQAAPTRSSGMILIFIITIVIVFVSGGFIPSVFLPQSIQQLAVLLPGNAFIRMIGGLLGADTGTKQLQWNLQVLIVWSSLFYLAALLINIRKGEADS